MYDGCCNMIRANNNKSKHMVCDVCGYAYILTANNNNRARGRAGQFSLDYSLCAII